MHWQPIIIVAIMCTYDNIRIKGCSTLCIQLALDLHCIDLSHFLWSLSARKCCSLCAIMNNVCTYVTREQVTKDTHHSTKVLCNSCVRLFLHMLLHIIMLLLRLTAVKLTYIRSLCRFIQIPHIKAMYVGFSAAVREPSLTYIVTLYSFFIVL